MAIDSAKKSRGRPAADTEAVNVRMTRGLLAELDLWITERGGKMGRPEAIRHIVSAWLAGVATARRAGK